MRIIKQLICLIKGHPPQGFRAPLKHPHTREVWNYWSGIRCARCRKQIRSKTGRGNHNLYR